MCDHRNIKFDQDGQAVCADCGEPVPDPLEGADQGLTHSPSPTTACDMPRAERNLYRSAVTQKFHTLCGEHNRYWT
jgi:molybdopterin-guanine dinucleotide biosynthesis protein A